MQSMYSPGNKGGSQWKPLVPGGGPSPGGTYYSPSGAAFPVQQRAMSGTGSTGRQSFGNPYDPKGGTAYPYSQYTPGSQSGQMNMGFYGTPGRVPRLRASKQALQRAMKYGNQGIRFKWMWDELSPWAPWANITVGGGAPGIVVPSSWTKCATPDDTCTATWSPPDYVQYQAASGCLAFGTCPTGQFLGPVQVFGSASALSGPQVAVVETCTAFCSFAPGFIQGSVMAQYHFNGSGVPSAVPTWGAGSVTYTVPVPEEIRSTYPRAGVSPRADPHIRRKPYMQPATDVVIGNGGTVHRYPSNHLRLPPSRGGIPQRKKSGNLSTKTAALYGKADEVLEFVNCLYSSVVTPAGHKLVNPNPITVNGVRVQTPQAKLAFIYNNFDNIDWSKVATCVAKNQVEDFVIGKSGQYLKKGLQNLIQSGLYSSPAGLSTGGFSQRLR